MRNGITPVMPLRAAGLNVAMRLDDKTINDVAEVCPNMTFHCGEAKKSPVKIP
jgi:hypothetical protein